jgi:hypothetical protein
MKSFAVLTGAGLLVLGSLGAAAAQNAPLSGTPGSPFPLSAPHEVVDGCRTVYNHATQRRDPVECVDALATGSIATAPGQPMMADPGMTGSIIVGPSSSVDPYAAPHEIRDGCRTVYNDATGRRDPVNCMR